MFVVYAIYNRDHGKIYVGQTIDLMSRIKEHNIHQYNRAYTSRFEGEWILFYTEEFDNRGDALFREKQLKSYRGREYLKKLINGPL